MDWEKVRVNAAIAAMEGILVNASYTTENREPTIAKLAVEQANALVEELRNNKLKEEDAKHPQVNTYIDEADKYIVERG